MGKIDSPRSHPNQAWHLKSTDCDSHLAASHPARTTTDHFALPPLPPVRLEANVCGVEAKDVPELRRALKCPALEAVGLKGFHMDIGEDGCGKCGGASTSSAAPECHSSP
eukprot:358088-Chlamydomonas_euryale.AAC.3